MYSHVVFALFYIFVIKTCWKSLHVQCEDYMTIKQFPSTAYVKYGTSALLACTVDFKSLSEAEFEVYWNMQLLNNTQKKLTLSSEHAQAGTKGIISEDDGKYKFEGNLLSGIVFLEVKNLQPRDRGLYTCQAACLIPTPYLEASNNGTHVYGVEDISQASSKTSDKFVICITIVVTCATVIVAAMLVRAWLQRKSPSGKSHSRPSRDSLIYVNMNIRRPSTKSERRMTLN